LAAAELPVVVRAGAGAAARGVAQAVAGQGGRSLPLPGLAALGYTAYAVPAAEAEAVAAGLRALPDVNAVTVAHSVAHTAPLADPAAPNDPGWAYQYGPERIQAPLAWGFSAGAEPVLLAIIDSGLDAAHPDLADHVWHNPAETPGNGRDDDANGYVDDVAGWDFYNGDAIPADDNGHGTHVAGIAAAVGNNGVGIAGVGQAVRVLPLKVLSSAGAGYDYQVAEAIIYAANLGARVINLSLGGYSLGAYVFDAVAYAHQRGALLVAASGNDGRASPFYPAAYDHVLAVGATDQANQRASFSNFGPHLDFAAPGAAIFSTLPGAGYGNMWGTSMAAPHVAGAAAVLAGAGGHRSPESIVEALRATALDLGAPGHDPEYGSGLPQVYAALLRTSLCPPGSCFQLFLPATLR
jgi:subtilisin family serine protease